LIGLCFLLWQAITAHSWGDKFAICIVAVFWPPIIGSCLGISLLEYASDELNYLQWKYQEYKKTKAEKKKNDKNNSTER